MARVEDINALESESGIIATLIHHPEFSFYSEQLLPNHFTNKGNRYIYAAICELVRRDIKTIDPYNIIEALSSMEATRSFSDEVSVDKLQELMDLSPSIARTSIEEYNMLVDNVLDASFRRDVYQKLRECMDLCTKPGEPDLEKKISSAIDEIIGDYSASEDVPEFKDVIDELWQEVEDHQDGKDTGIPFKFPTLNEYVRIEQGELVVLGAPAKGAKSMFMLGKECWCYLRRFTDKPICVWKAKKHRCVRIILKSFSV